MDAYTHEKITNYKTHFDSLFPSSLVPLFEREFKCEPILMKMTLDLHENETACRTHFHMKGFPLRLVLTQTHKRTRKWPIDDPPSTLERPASAYNVATLPGQEAGN